MPVSTKGWNNGIRILCFIGISLSIYALYVEVSKKHNPNYVALCDVSEHMSCSNVLNSSFSTGFGIFSKDSMLNQPNSLFGIIFYSTFFLLSYLNFKIVSKLLIILAVVSNISSVYFACILIFILKDFCLVCVSTYFVNVGLLFCSIYKTKILDIESKKSKIKSK
ncbi:unnamed protein product [Bemisia tabaci]|uniref:vitamin-K-epoxide reductase (warfarin-sensitive) n=1 Tax=Bemisia tabaci TaxID=7038 RepID=A0A9N9ZZ71_BEMTA|nr:unnamed protein product [Bemisia tabaci]